LRLCKNVENTVPPEVFSVAPAGAIKCLLILQFLYQNLMTVNQDQVIWKCNRGTVFWRQQCR